MTTSMRLQEILDAHRSREAPLLPILHEVQAAFGCVDSEAEAAIARAEPFACGSAWGGELLSRFPRAK